MLRQSEQSRIAMWCCCESYTVWRSNQFWHSTSLSPGSRSGSVLSSEVRGEFADSDPSICVVRAAAWSRLPSCCDHAQFACSLAESSLTRSWITLSSHSYLLLQLQAITTRWIPTLISTLVLSAFFVRWRYIVNCTVSLCPPELTECLWERTETAGYAIEYTKVSVYTFWTTLQSYV